MTPTERLWDMLPDRCECLDCERRGFRGEEVNVGGNYVCWHCYLRQGNIRLGTSWWDRHPRLRWPVAVLAFIYFAFFLTAPLHPWMPSVRWW